MERHVRSTRDIEGIIKRTLDQTKGTVLGPKFFTKGDRLPDRYIGMNTTRDLLIYYLQSIKKRDSPEAILLSFSQLSSIETSIMEIALEKGTFLIIVSPVGTPVDRRLPKILPLEKRYNSLKNILANPPEKKGKILLLVSSDEELEILQEELKALRSPPTKKMNIRDFYVVSKEINNQIASVYYDTIIVSSNVQRRVYVEDEPSVSTYLPRTIPDMSVLIQRGKTIYGPYPKEQSPYIDDSTIQDLSMILRSYSYPSNIPLLLLEDEIFLDAQETLRKNGLLDSFFLPTALGKKIMLYNTGNIQGSLFLLYWLQEKENSPRFIFPGCVIAAFINNIYLFPTLEYGEGTTLERFLLLWHDMTVSLEGKILEEETIPREWLQEKSIDASTIHSIMSVIRNLKYLVKITGPPLYGRFTVEGAIERSSPILRRIYGSSFHAVRKDDTYVREGETLGFSVDPIRQTIIVLLISDTDNTIQISLPLE